MVRGDDTRAIQSIGTDRQRYVDTLTRLDAERADACRMFSFGNGRGALERLFEWADPRGGLQRQWTANLDLARRCKALNDQNGAIVAAKLGRVQTAARQTARHQPAAGVQPQGRSRYGELGLRDLGRA